MLARAALFTCLLVAASAQFTEYQQLPASGPQYVASGSLESDSFLGILNTNGPSSIYVWNSTVSLFDLVQELPQTGNDLMSDFLTYNGNLYYGISNSPSSFVYIWDADTRIFNLLQTINYQGGDVSFTVGDETAFMALAGTSTQPSQIYMLGSKGTFELIQSIPSGTGSLWVDFFSLGSDLYLVTAGATSTVFLWQNTQFAQVQNFTIDVHPESFNLINVGNTTVFMVSGAYLGPPPSYTGSALLLQWNDTIKSFQPFQFIGIDDLVVGSIGFNIDGDDYLAFCNIAVPFVPTNSIIYKLNTSTMQFEAFQSIKTGLVIRWAFLAIGEDNYLAAAYDYAPLGQTPVFKWTGPQMIAHE